MTIDVEAGGALASATLVAKAIEPSGGQKQSEVLTDHPCANCGAQLAGAYCHRCGQAAHLHRSLWHIGEEALHGMFHFDTKSWRTIPLLVARPGLLTRRYIDGQRVRYVSPLPLFLFSIFLMFFVVSWVSGNKSPLSATTEAERAEGHAELAKAVDEAQAEVAKQTAALANLTNEEDRKEATLELSQAKAAQQTAQALLATFDAATERRASTESKTPVTVVAKPAGVVDIDTGSVKLNDIIRRSAANPELMIYKIKNTAYKFSFMLIPISLPFLWLMFFWRRGVTMYDHAVFSLYSLSFMSFFFIVVALMNTTSMTKHFIGLAMLVPPVHMFVHLRGTYSLGFGSALWRTLALLCVAGTVFLLFILMIIAISVTES